jgi:hypothetical protein
MEPMIVSGPDDDDDVVKTKTIADAIDDPVHIDPADPAKYDDVLEGVEEVKLLGAGNTNKRLFNTEINKVMIAFPQFQGC